jgi:16S rRNA (cytidine1402-2'-O)-methyltransferase
VESGLYIVATPIGNLGDISSRAIQVLQSVDLIAAEDTRHSRRLFQQFAIDTPCFAYHDFSDRGAQERVLARLAQGEAVALVSDAGTPLISDPGFRLVRDVQEAGFRVFPVPGACAAIAALCVAGLPTDRFVFEGFLPAKAGARAARLMELAAEESTTIFYEAPHRIVDSLQAMVEAFGGDREAVLAREITKAYETVRRAPLAELAGFVAADSNQQRGEIVLIVAGQPAGQPELDARLAGLLQRLAQEMPGKRAAAIVAEFSGLKKNQLYDYLLAQRTD